MGDIVGVATISRAEHRARQGRSPLKPPVPADAIDAELVEPADENGLENRPDSPEGAMRYPEAGDEPDGDMPPASGELMTLEDAAEANREAARVRRLKTN